MKKGEFPSGLTSQNTSLRYHKEQPFVSNSRYEASPPSYFDASQGFNDYGTSTSTSTSQQHLMFNQHQAMQQQRMQNGMFNADSLPSINKQNKARFGNPLAHNETWSPTAEDYSLVRLPKIDYMLRIQSRLGRKAGNVFDLPPVSFSRPVPPSVSRVASRGFHPVILRSENKSGLIGSGFKPFYSGRIFSPLDVSAADLSRFLEDIITAGKLSVGGHIVANAAPISMHMGLTGFLVTKAISNALLRRNEKLVIETIEIWQENFFAPRGIDMFVIVDGERVTASYMGGIPSPLSPEIAELVGKDKWLDPQDSSENINYDLDNTSGSDSDESLDSHKSTDSQGNKLSRKERENWKKNVKALRRQREKLRKENKEARKREKEERKKMAKRHKEEKKAHEKNVKKLNEVPLLVFVPLVNSN